MTEEFICNVINSRCADSDLVVLKGFAPDLIAAVGHRYTWLDSYMVNNGKVCLANENRQLLLAAIVGLTPSTRPAVCTCESFIGLCSAVTGLDVFGKRISVLENNLLDLYPNPSDADIPDFDSEAFMDTEGDTPAYSACYSYCLHEDGEARVQYINNYQQGNTSVTVVPLIETADFTCDGHAAADAPVISATDGSLKATLRQLYEEMTLPHACYAVKAEEADATGLRVLMGAARTMGLTLHIGIAAEEADIKPRPALTQLLQQVWGYTSFRSLKMYRDLNVNHDVTEVSQGTIIETVVRQAEHALRGESSEVSNVLLTSPTGAGKSLLFQLSAIYLATEYDALTIIVSPLVALMNDQVEGLTGYDGVATLNSNKTATEKENIMQGVRDGSINLLYLSPELLLSYSITTFTGTRRLGLMVVDEAHTVTTWGRDFRVDYWFLGDYLRKARRVLGQPFPIFALTATAVWDPSGRNDMVFDTIRSLGMDPCIKFIGVVRRDNITFEIEQSGITTKYELQRRLKTISRIREALAAGRKAIFYFPFKRTVDGIYLGDEVADIQSKLARYHSNLRPDEKLAYADAFRSGEKPVMCATKAFGMGIDVADITEVYHHAPTGCLSDYVQEIGRLARDPSVTGIAKIDFSPSDFRYIRKLHGLSAIKPYQLRMVLKKLMALFRINGEKRNMLVSSSDFDYIFPLSDADGVDQNLKSCLLLISNDLLNKLRFHALIVRPKSLFSKCFVEVPHSEAADFRRLYRPYLRRITDCLFTLDADRYWTDRHANISFPKFKKDLAEGSIFRDFHVTLKHRVTVSLNASVADTRTTLEEFFRLSHAFLNEMCRTHHRIAVSSMKEQLPRSYDSARREQFVETFRLLYATPHALGGDIAAFCRVFTVNEGAADARQSFQLMQSGYENVANLYLRAFDDHIHERELCTYCGVGDDIVRVCECLNSLGIADYQRVGGDDPCVFVRINNPFYLNRLAHINDYENDILKSIYDKYEYSEKVFTYFFTTPMSDKQRWDFIEAYFLGASEDELLHFV